MFTTCTNVIIKNAVEKPFICRKGLQHQQNHYPTNSDYSEHAIARIYPPSTLIYNISDGCGNKI